MKRIVDMPGILAGNPVAAPFIRAIRMHQLRKVPAEVCIETTSVCNARCLMCPRDRMRRPKAVMDFKLFKKIVDECVDLKVKCVKPHNYGEPFATPSFEKYIEYIRKRSRRIEIILVTNGMLMLEKSAEALIENKVDQVNISIDGTSKETYEKIRQNCVYETVVANTLRLIELKRSRKARYPRVLVEIIRMPETEKEIPAFIKYWRELADEVAVTGYSTRAGALTDHGLPSRTRVLPCFRLWKQLVVCSNGDVAVCCADWDCLITLGNLKNQSIREIWTGPEIINIRKIHLQRKKNEIELCRQCNLENWDVMPDWWYQ